MSRGCEGGGDLRISRGRVVELADRLEPRRRDRVIDLDGHWVLPGLINCHDHLGLDLLPPLGSPPYASFYQWAEEIYRPKESPLADLERVPMGDRLAWGGWRNILGGATTVAHHDPWHRRAFGAGAFPVRVVRCAWGHSLGFEDDLRACYRPDRPFVVHAAEGADGRAAGEVGELERLGVLRENTILIHAMALSDRDIAILARRKCKVVWCPASNFRLYGKTAPVAELRSIGVDVVLGTDSTISGSPTLLHELRVAAGTGLASAGDLLAMVTHGAAAAFGLDDGRGALEPRGPADVIVIPKRGSAGESLLAAEVRDVALVLVGGRPRLARTDIAVALELGEPNASIDDEPFHLDQAFTLLRARLARALGDDFPHSDLWALCR